MLPDAGTRQESPRSVRFRTSRLPGFGIRDTGRTRRHSPVCRKRTACRLRAIGTSVNGRFPLQPQTYFPNLYKALAWNLDTTGARRLQQGATPDQGWRAERRMRGKHREHGGRRMRQGESAGCACGAIRRYRSDWSERMGSVRGTMRSRGARMFRLRHLKCPAGHFFCLRDTTPWPECFAGSAVCMLWLARQLYMTHCNPGL